MNDTKTTINDLKQKVRAFIDERDWNQFHSPKNLSMGISVEASELMEKFLWIESEESRELVETKRQEIENELADIIIVSLAFANQCNIDISKAVTHKIEEIKGKYPVAKTQRKAS